MAAKDHLRLGDILLQEGLVTASQLQEAIKFHKTSGKRLGEALISLHYMTETQLAEILARQMNLPYRRFDKGELRPANDPLLKKIIPDKIIRTHLVLPLQKEGKNLTVAVADPFDLLFLDNLKKITNCRILPSVATRSDLIRAIEEVYGKHDYLREALKEAVEGSYGKEVEEGTPTKDQVEILPSEEQIQSVEDLAARAGEAQVVRLVDLFLVDAVNSRASDIHVEPYADSISIRFRIDGVLHPVEPPSAHLMPAIISRIKILSRMDIAEKRLPQDGGFSVRLGDKTVDLRVSTIPVVYGEKVVIRLLDKSHLLFDLKQLGMEGRALSDVEEGIQSSYGLVFLTGPTGSGKSTTLYALLNTIKSPKKNIITIEDPIEYKMEGINQVQAKPQIGLTFAAGLRAFLRQDPDILMVGEVRDLETAEICLRAALTGHLVLSTLHTNDAASAITRLIDIGVEPFLLSPSLLLLIAQRLVRKLCLECRESYEPPMKLRDVSLPKGTYYRPQGCKACAQTGYWGRMGIFEVMHVNEKIRRLIGRNASSDEIKHLAREEGMKTLVEDGVLKASAGMTSLEEVLSVTVGEF